MRTRRLSLVLITLGACGSSTDASPAPTPAQPEAAAPAAAAGGASAPASAFDAGAARSDANAIKMAADAGVRGLDASGLWTDTDAGRAEAAAGGAAKAEDGNQAPVTKPGKAAEPCSDDLGFVGGRALPAFGAQTGLDGAALDLEKLGSYAVHEQTLTIPLRAETRSVAGYDIQIQAGKIDATVYAPSMDRGKTIAPGKFALLVAGPGFGAGYADYAQLFQHFASHGVLVLGINTRSDAAVSEHDKEALETSQAISWIIQANDFTAHLDPDKIAVSGHSKGGKVAFFTAAIDPRVDIAFGWDPSNAGGPPCEIAASLGVECNALPVAPNCLAQKEGKAKAEGILQYSRAESFIFGVPPDASANPSPEHNAIHFYRGALSPASLVYMNGAHAAWLTGGVGALLGDPKIVAVTKAVQTAKLLRVFYGATGVERYLPGGDYLQQRGSLIRQVATK